MADAQEPGNGGKEHGNFHSTIGNVSNSQIVVGHGSSINMPQLTETENSELRQLFDELRRQVAAGAPPDIRGDAVKQVEEVEHAVTDEEEPDIGRIESAVRWFKRHLPSLVGAVLSVIVHPIVGKLVQAGGDALVQEFDRRFGQEPY